MGIIYCYTNIINNKKYIGQTINPEERKAAHKSSSFNPKASDYEVPFHRAIRKYGIENFKYEVLLTEFENDIELLNNIEKYYIQKNNSQVPNGYNIEEGGHNSSKPKTQEWKEKLTWGQAELTLEEITALRYAYANNESPSKIYQEKYQDRLHYASFLNIWSGRRYKNILPELLQKGRHTKINQEIADSIRRDREELGISYAKLGEKYNVSKSTVADIVNGRTWNNSSKK